MVDISNKLGANISLDYAYQNFKSNSLENCFSQISELIKSLEILFCVASSGPENKIKLNLELTGLLPYFELKLFAAIPFKSENQI